MAPPPILKLDDINHLRLEESPEVRYCHTYGIFNYSVGSREWYLCDETCRILMLKLLGDLKEYPIPKPADIIRIHRLTFNSANKFPVIMKGKDVVIWRAFEVDPTPITDASSPTITADDTKRRKELEIYYESILTPVSAFSKVSDKKQLINVAGQIEKITTDTYDHLILRFRDATGSFDLRVFAKKLDSDSRLHHDVACTFFQGDFFLATAVNVDSNRDKLNLSANEYNGRSIRRLPEEGYLGRKLSLALAAIDASKADPPTQRSPPQTQPLRKSPRLASMNGNQASNSQPPNTTATIIPDRVTNTTSQHEEDPEFTRLSDIPEDSPRRGFYDLVGQVRGTPNETTKFNNWVFQLYDGSKIRYASYFIPDVIEPIEGCVVVKVYSKQKPEDTDKHVESVKKLKEGDLVFLRNVSGTWVDRKLKLEMSANLSHNKSITVIEKTTRFGSKINDIVTNPIVEELTSRNPLDSTQLTESQDSADETMHDDQ